MTMLHFDFHRQPTTYKNPIKIITATELYEVIPSLIEIQESVNQGYYAAGFLSYEAAPAFEQAMKVQSENKMPLLWFGIYEDACTEQIKTSSESFYISDWKFDTSTKDYYQAIRKIKNEINNGNTYQVNYTVRMHANFHGDAYSFYEKLSLTQSANYCAFLDIGDYQIISASPELFFHLKDGKLTTKPMKGTIGRGRTQEDDQANAEWLFHSEKNRAENVMIVDLLRNDLGMIAKPGSVCVPELFSIEAYPTVYQMTSTVTAEIDSQIGILDIFKALFPCGSITGAPKISTMKSIYELESSARDVYCGAIGFITPKGEAVFNVPIRTVIIDQYGNATYGVGGGITWDSDESEEYEEVLTKAKVLSKVIDDFQLLETIGLVDGEFIVLENHIKRIQDSAKYFQFVLDVKLLKQRLLEEARTYPEGNWKVRILLYKNGEFSIQTELEPPLENKKRFISLAKTPIKQADIFLYHKTTNRTVYDKSLEHFSDVFDVLLWNEQGEVTEFTRGNIVVEIDGNLFTPPVTCGVLAGTYRKALLDEGKIKERVITVKDVSSCNRIWFINSVKKWVEVILI